MWYSSGDFKEIAQQFRPFEREKTLGVELHAVQRPGAVPDAHDLALLRPGADDEIGVVERLAADDQRVVARRLKRVGQPAENALAVVEDRRRLAVHDADVADHFTPENVADALMAQTDSQHRH